MGLKVYVDGELFDEADAKISVFDHGLLYGDGVFEGIRFYEGRVFRCEQHIERLFSSAQAIALTLPWSPSEVTEAMLKTIRANGLRDGYVRLVVTRGTGGLGLNPYLCENPSMFIIASTISLYPLEKYRDGLTLVTCSTRRPTPASLSPQVKSLNYLTNVMAKIEALQGGGEEGLMLNEQGQIAECTGDNLFIVHKGIVLTPPIAAGALNGITRAVIVEAARELGIPLEERTLGRYDLYTADECFLTGTAAEVVPVAVCDQRRIGATSGTSVPGPVTSRLMERFHELTKNTGTPIYN